MTDDLSTDPRWLRFNDKDSPCPCCGRVFQGVFDLGYDHPDPWPHGNRAERGMESFEVGDDRLTSDLCSIGPHRFIRALLPLPIKGSDQTFAFGPWGSVNPENFDRWIAACQADGFSDFEGCFAWLMNKLPGVEMDDWLPCDLIPHEDPSKRPALFVHDGHPLAVWQEQGISFDHLLDIYAAAGQDIRPHLMDA
ncbi:MAG: DUF2199 domain-containing protein [Paracoccaceae bacterium]|nr:DUF2199 domain-containing protein [Paracoccaceae bacterium]